MESERRSFRTIRPAHFGSCLDCPVAVKAIRNLVPQEDGGVLLEKAIFCRVEKGSTGVVFMGLETTEVVPDYHEQGERMVTHTQAEVRVDCPGVQPSINL